MLGAMILLFFGCVRGIDHPRIAVRVLVSIFLVLIGYGATELIKLVWSMIS